MPNTKRKKHSNIDHNPPINFNKIINNPKNTF